MNNNQNWEDKLRNKGNEFEAKVDTQINKNSHQHSSGSSKWNMNNNSNNGVTGAATAVTSTLGNAVGGVSRTLGGVVGAAGRGVGDTGMSSIAKDMKLHKQFD